MPGRHVQPDHSKGDPNTLGGYMAVHDRPAAFEGSDGMSYSVEILADATNDPSKPFAGYLLFPRWRRIGSQGVEGHLESAYLAHAESEDDAKRAVGAMSLNDVRSVLELLIQSARERQSSRRWYDVMKDDGA